MLEDTQALPLPYVLTDGLIVAQMLDIIGYEGRYAVTDDGRIWAYPNRLHDGKWLKPVISSKIPGKDYLIVSLCKGEAKNYAVHTLVALMFMGARPEGMSINHIDGNKINNSACNLEYVTSGDNTRHAWATGLIDRKKRQENAKRARTFSSKRDSLTANQVRAVRAEYKPGNGIELARKYGVSRDVIRGIIKKGTYRNVV